MKRAGTHVSAPVRGVYGSSPRIFFTLHVLRLILMQSWQRNVDEMKYTIANITMNIIVSLLSQECHQVPYSNELFPVNTGDLNTLVNKGICTVDLHVG